MYIPKQSDNNRAFPKELIKCKNCGFVITHCQCPRQKTRKIIVMEFLQLLLKKIRRISLNIVCKYYRKKTEHHYSAFEKSERKYQNLDRKRGIIIAKN